VAGGGGDDSMLQFRLEGRGDGMNHCWKVKKRQQARLGSMERECDMARRCDNVNRRRGGTEEEKGRRQR
jgi:hypothetical protein